MVGETTTICYMFANEIRFDKVIEYLKDPNIIQSSEEDIKESVNEIDMF